MRSRAVPTSRGYSSSRRGGARESAGPCSRRTLAEMRSRAYRKAQLFTATANQRSRILYEHRGWRAIATDTHKHDDLWLTGYERSLVD
jgi:hypothetical protein